MGIRAGIADLHAELTAWRRDLHSHPEIGFEEERTSAFVSEKLEAWGVDVHRGIGRTGVVGVITGRPGNRSIGLRADMDALAMEEDNQFGYRSQIPNRMHGCGHDGHTTMLLGAAKYLAETRNFSGTVNLIFQPAEEGLAGARVMIEDGLFERFPCQAVYGIHNDPSTALGLVNVRAGGMLAAVDYFKITVRGSGSHGGQPHLGIDPVSASAQVITALNGIVSRRADPLDAVVISIGMIHGGTVNNVIPEKVEIAGSIRTLKASKRAKTEAMFYEAVVHAAKACGASAEIDYDRAYPPTINTPEEAAIAAKAASVVVGEGSILPDEPSWTAGEDFAFMLEKVPGAYAFFGQGTAERGRVPLHNPKYDFNDDLLPIGATYFVELVEQVLSTS